MKRFFRNVAAATLLAGVFVALVVVVGSQTAAFSAPTVSAGQFCGKSDHMAVKVAGNGDTVQCLPPSSGSTWKWKAVTAAPATTVASPSTSTSASASQSVSPSSTPSSSASTSGVPVIANVTDDSLPVTGTAVVVASLFGGGLLALGVGLVALTRRRPTRFSA